MPIIRRKLDANTVYPTNLRYNSDTDTVQSLVNGDWVDNPQADPRTQTTFPPRLTSDPACDAAESVKDALKGQIDSILTAIDNASTLFTIAGIILSIFTFGTFAIFIDIALGIGGAMVSAGSGAITAALTDPVYETFKCILRCHMNSSGRLNPGELPIVETEVNDQIGGLGATILNAMLSLAGEGGINNLASLGTSTGDCSDCGCVVPCATAVDNGFEYGTDIEYDVNESSGITTVTGSSILVGSISTVRWGFYGDSISEGCHFLSFNVFGSTCDDWYYRVVGEASSTVHGPVSHEALITDAGGQCLNLMQTNCASAFTFELKFYGC